ncbi:MAG: outer membrane lipoprotein-sorting protein [Spirochaetae bacterium HGW-Spirochaetae-2]|nr:MAG: outer membrane lipoprotein-sorting protein [Spirochaetae bacterium HGW-Spirochaetae-2]
MYRSNNMKIRMMAIVMVALVSIATVGAMSAEDIVRQMDALETFDTSYAEGEIVTTDRFGVKTSTFRSWSRGAYDSLIEFTSVAERGQKVLRTEGELYLFYPDAEELIRLQGAALRQSMLGSDISYEDMTGEKDTLSQYDVKLVGNERISGRDCYILEFSAKTRTVAYPMQKVWVDTGTYMVWKGEFSTKAGRLLKEMAVLETMTVDNRTLPKITKISDKMKRDSATEMRLSRLDIDVDLDPVIFTLQNLTW